MDKALIILAIIDSLFGLATKLYSIAQQIAGDVPIPPLDEIIAKHKANQDAIEQAKLE